MKNIQANIKHLRSLRQFSQERFADELGWSRSMVGSYEEGRSEPPIDRLIDLSNFFNLPIDILVKNDLRKATDSSFIQIGSQRVLFPITVSEDNEDLIEIVPAQASAGYLAGYADPEYIEQLQKIKLPFLPTGTHRAFPIKGDSMLPVKSGSFIVAKYVEDVSDVKNGRTYIVLTKNDGLVYKRVYNFIEARQALQLSSDNKTYEPYDVAIADVLELWEFTCCINTQEYDEKELKMSSIMSMFQDLKVELEAVQKMG
ncbi:LexA family transcriptional regulator [Subsaximicrobium wynnwilliamsii]|jgi:transcriptional regulator with XRE-family HTH domain|uniref:LexA family transcriptional regulator n=1 Tax=Subsaximicrobium wynnwilliamsii TaxID=291179 RepID=A0A5C6ZCX6_9FLAO|nr:LexA family transcriptional regulator [Subsaximicrobium wynnwilliamsii]TXD81211.1 LexA family transcriptional regulator [Subsaximicrobium wynnwilliamsii]TXD86929.1 LexA family transcriptional regulator [Subsaximicrobium wynnwilliamsii]TXE00558.1 LexA family transcriptional regulator [Subsaximicrobium wynnwilliamsii]